jgi:hypothetical protein
MASALPCQRPTAMVCNKCVKIVSSQSKAVLLLYVFAGADMQQGTEEGACPDFRLSQSLFSSACLPFCSIFRARAQINPELIAGFGEEVSTPSITCLAAN